MTYPENFAPFVRHEQVVPGLGGSSVTSCRLWLSKGAVPAKVSLSFISLSHTFICQMDMQITVVCGASPTCTYFVLHVFKLGHIDIDVPSSLHLGKPED